MNQFQEFIKNAKTESLKREEIITELEEEKQEIFDLQQESFAKSNKLENENKRLQAIVTEIEAREAENTDRDAKKGMIFGDILAKMQIFSSKKVSKFEVRYSDEVSVYGREVCERIQYPSDQQLTEHTIQQLQPLKIGLNGRALICQFGNLEEKTFGATKSELYFQSAINQLSLNPVCHIKKIRFKKSKFQGCSDGNDFGTHISIEFLSHHGYILGKFENVDWERVVERKWKGVMKWNEEVLEDKIISTLENDEKIVGICLGIGKIDENKDFVESFKFVIAKIED